MPQPVNGDVHVNGPLTNISVAYVQNASSFIATRAFPVVPVSKQSDLYFVYSREDFLRDEARPRAPASESAGGGYNLAQQQYSALVEAFHKDVDDQVRANADAPLNMDRDATQFVTQKLLIRREVRWMQNFFQSGVWSTDITPGTLWSAAGSSPIANVQTGQMAIQSATGFKPNTLVVGPRVHAALLTNADIVERVKYTSAQSVNEEVLARLFGVERYLVANAVRTTGTEGGTQTTDFIAGRHALLCYSAPSPSLMQPTAGYTFAWSGFIGATEGMRMKSFRMDHLSADRIEGEMAYDMRVVAAPMGYFFNNVVA